MVGEAADFAPSTRFAVFPLNLNGSSNITTAISEVSSAKKAKTIRYYNTLGTESPHTIEQQAQIPHKIPLVSEKSHSPKQSA